SAGMPPVLVRRGGSESVEEILLPGVPLGTLPDVDYPVQETPIGSGDVVLIMSDGVIETINSAGDAFGYRRASSYLSGCDGDTAEEIVNGLLDAAMGFAGTSAPHDDITVLAMVVG
ncbi:MAG: serine/threonine-protein phosphatase, partial [Acidobacteria bacterium]|nr:serine/threonine-protein phosphatase [Acidobacteriota bacterium]